MSHVAVLGLLMYFKSSQFVMFFLFSFADFALVGRIVSIPCEVTARSKSGPEANIHVPKMVCAVERGSAGSYKNEKITLLKEC